MQVLAQDPRPGYRHGDEGRRYGVRFARWDVRFYVAGGVLHVEEVLDAAEDGKGKAQ